MAAGVFEPRLHEVALVPAVVRAADRGRAVGAGEVADDDVQVAVGAEPHGVGAVLALASRGSR